MAVGAADAAGYANRSIYARWRWAEALLARSASEPGARTRAESVVGEAVRRAAANEHTPLLRELHALARRARLAATPVGHGVADSAQATDLGLTARETDVLRLLAEGLTNKQIAAALYISEKTAEHHVSHILGKLGVTTRTAAGSVAHRLGLQSLRTPVHPGGDGG